VSLQLALLPAAQLKVERSLLRPDQLSGHEHSHPRSDLIGLVRDLGLLQLPFAASIDGELFTLVEGRRRTKAVLILIETGQWPGEPLVECATYVGPEAAHPEKMAAITLALHATRAESIATEMRLLEQIFDGNPEVPEHELLAQIVKQTTMQHPAITRRLRLRNLIAELRAAVERGAISQSTAEVAARLPEDAQRELAERLAAGEKVTAKSARAMKNATRHAASAALPDHLFQDQPTPWPTTVGGHITAAIAATPDAPGTAELSELLTRARDLVAVH
jgi:hypothetical protein